MSTTLIVEKKETVEMELTETTRKEYIIKEVLVRKKILQVRLIIIFT